MPVYRNQTSTMSQIQMMGRMRITTPQEAVAFLRALAPLQTQVAYVLQRSSLNIQQNINREVQKPISEPTPVEAPTPVQQEAFVPEDLSSEEGFSEKEVEEKVAKLKKARKK